MFDPASHDDTAIDEDTPIETLCCALLYLLSRQAQDPGRQLQKNIRDHMRRIAMHRDVAYFPLLMKTCGRLALHWEHQGHNDPVFPAGMSETRH